MPDTKKHGIGTDEHLGLSRNGQSYFYLTDGLGSVAKVVDAGKNVVQSYSYDSYGLPQATTGFRNSFTFTGREWDGDLGLLYLRARYYDPVEGVFISRDPLGWTADVNVYRYVGGNPGNAVDPWGLIRIANGMMYDDNGNIIDGQGLEAPNPFLDPVNYVGGFGGGFLKWLNRPFWRYVGPNSNPTSGWMTRGCGWKPPYGSNFDKAKDALQMPFSPTDVIRVDVPWYRLVRGPRPANLHPEWGRGGGSEYFRGWRWPE